MPDIRADEGENIATEKISRENIELRDAIKRRTVELEQKNQELAMEASLERVRTVAMGMRKPDDLPGICEVLFNELQSMGFTELRNAMINIHNDEKSTFINYDYSEEIGPSINHLNYTIHPVIEKQIKQIRSTHDAFSETVFSGQDLEDWKAFRKRIGEKDDPRIDNVSALYYYFYSIGTGAIGISTFGPISVEKLDQLKRFRNVFEFAYRRYMDVTNAEAQAREAQIEASLERIRAASLAMRDSSALGGIIFQLYGELTKLDAKLDRCFIMIVNPENKGITWWMAGQEGLLAENGFFVQMNQHPSHLMYLDHCDKRKKKWTYLFEGKEKSDCDHFIFTQTELARLSEPIKAFMSAAKQVHLSGSSDQFGSIVTGSFEPLPDEQQEIISRFTIAFNQAFIRFLDLQKAEAQAREAQIEAALERVRSRSMAMHKSDELLEAGEILFLEMQKLGIESLTAGYVLIDKQEKNGLNYTPHPGTKKIMPVPVIIPHNETIQMQQVVENWKKGKPFFIVEMDEEETIKHQTFIAERSTNFPLTAAQLIAISPAKLVLHNFYFKEGYVLIVGGLKLSAEQTDIMLRFAKVFQQTYTRFLDLQKAEAQAREAAIELGLERVRARAMAMQRSDELSELVDTVFKELTKLDFALNWCMINIIDESSMSNTVWAANPDINEAPESYHMLFENYPFHDAMMKGWKERKTKDVYVLEGEEKKVYDEYLFNETEFRRVPAAAQAASRAMEKYVVTFTFSNFGGLQTVGEVPLSDANIDILSRFGKVFDLTYTRFNDLQKAEAQAREAQIEAALERVRSRSMAMHSSQELIEVALELRKQMGLLGQKDLEACAIHLYDDDDSFESWSAMKAPGSESEILQTQARFPKQGIKIVDELMKHYSNGSRDYVLVNEGEKIVEWLNLIQERAPGLHASIMQSIGNMQIKNPKANWSVADFSGGALVMVTYGEPDVQSRNLLRRSANVFEQAYIRFKDLKQAEQQARDSQIEVALKPHWKEFVQEQWACKKVRSSKK